VVDGFAVRAGTRLFFLGVGHAKGYHAECRAGMVRNVSRRLRWFVIFAGTFREVAKIVDFAIDGFRVVNGFAVIAAAGLFFVNNAHA
jgi:hypothetical protein